VSAAAAPLLSLTGVACEIAGNAVVRDVSFALARGELVALLGPSGCGKTTLLRAIAGFDPIAAGRIELRGAEVSTPRATLAPEQRGLGFVFQDLALFPHLSVADNVAFGLRRAGREERAGRVREALQRLDLSALAGRYPHELSGGQQQRVAVARAIAPRPDLLLLDEPLSSLDARLRARLRVELRTLLRSLGIAALFVTHDQDEAFAFADRIGVLHDGRLEQWATPFELYHRPATPFVADFVGEGRLLLGVSDGAGAIRTALGDLRANGSAPAAGAEVRVLIRPDDLRTDPASPLRAEVTGAAFRGAETLYSLRLDNGEEVWALFPSHETHATGARIGIATDIEHVVVFPAAAPGS
jgi:iron(III) transport system ATP-binding protein